MELLGWAEERPIFNLNEAQRALDLKRDYLRTKLQRAVERGDLKRIERGKYTAHNDPMIYGSFVERPSFISLWSGLRYYDLSTQTPVKVDVMSSSGRRDLEDVRFHHSENMFGYGREEYRGIMIMMASMERLLIDCLSRREVPVSELTELVDRVDIRETIRMAEKYGKNSVRKRLGFLFERIRHEEVEELKPRDRNYVPLDLSRKKNGEKNSRWMVEVNTDAF